MIWENKKLSEICDVRDGTHDSPSYQSEGVPLVTSKNLVNGKLDFTKVSFISEYDHESISKRSAVSNGDILFAMIGTVGNPVIVDTDTEFSIKNVGLIKVDENSDIYNKFLIFALNSDFVTRQIQRESKGGTQKFISLKVLRNLKIPLPPLLVQKQIAAVLEKADNLRQQSKKMEQALNSLAQSVFLDMFGDPKSNPKRWQKKTLKNILEKLVGGKSLAAPEQQSDVSDYRVLKISAVTSGQFNPLESKALPADYIPPKEHFVQVNDLLISRANTTELVGATTMVFHTPENLLLPDKLWKFQWKESEPLSQIFMWKLLSSKAMRHRLSEISSGSGGSMKNISKSKLLELEVIFPDYEKQMEYENFYLRLRDQMLLNKEYISQAEGQFKSLIQRAFKGELDLNDVA